MAISHQPAVMAVADQAYRLQSGSVIPVVEVRSVDSSTSEEIDMGSQEDVRLITDPAKLQ